MDQTLVFSLYDFASDLHRNPESQDGQVRRGCPSRFVTVCVSSKSPRPPNGSSSSSSRLADANPPSLSGAALIGSPKTGSSSPSHTITTLSTQLTDFPWTLCLVSQRPPIPDGVIDGISTPFVPWLDLSRRAGGWNSGAIVDTAIHHVVAEWSPRTTHCSNSFPHLHGSAQEPGTKTRIRPPGHEERRRTQGFGIIRSQLCDAGAVGLIQGNRGCPSA